MRKNLIKLFKILDTKLEDRDTYLDDDLNQFSYVNGGLFSNVNIGISLFSTNIINFITISISFYCINSSF